MVSSSIFPRDFLVAVVGDREGKGKRLSNRVPPPPLAAQRIEEKKPSSKQSLKAVKRQEKRPHPYTGNQVLSCTTV